MSSDLQALQSHFKLVRGTLERHGHYLPATLDEPPEEPEPPDMDRLDDDSNFDRINMCASVEGDCSGALSIDPGPMLHCNERHLFRFFIDGSIRSYYLGEQLENGRSYPIIATEVASAAVTRSENGRISIAGFRRKIALLAPPSPPMLPETVRELMELKRQMAESNCCLKLDVITLKQSERREGIDLRASLLARARAEMHFIEHELAHQVGRKEGEWLVLDGAIRAEEFLGLQQTIGLAKSFSRNPLFRTRDRGLFDVVSLVSSLREGERTPVFKHELDAESEAARHMRQVAFWYTRLRSGRGLEGPLQGIVKVDYRVEKNQLDTIDIEIANRITRALAAERCVSPYPTRRWHAHIYPIFAAENYIKANLLSPLIFRGYFGAG